LRRTPSHRDCRDESGGNQRKPTHTTTVNPTAPSAGAPAIGTDLSIAQSTPIERVDCAI